MENRIYGVTDMQVHYGVDYFTKITIQLAADPEYETSHLLKESWADLFPGNVIVKCAHCGQFSARKTDCKKCGAPVE